MSNPSPHVPEAQHHLHGAAMRLLYKIIAPRNPRGWLDFHAVREPGDRTLWIHCHGMERWNLPNMEILGVPWSLGGYAHGLMFELLGYCKNTKQMNADETFGGYFTGAEQIAPHLGVLRASPCREAGHEGMLRVVDEGQPAEAGFPYRLFATHISALGWNQRKPERAVAQYREALKIFPGDYAGMTEGLDSEAGKVDSAVLQQKSNLSSWDGLAHALFCMGQDREGAECFEQAIARCPGWARFFKQFVLEEEAGSPLTGDAYVRFWSDADIDEICARLRPS